MDPNPLIYRYLSGEATPAEIRELDQLLAADPALRRTLIFEAGLDAGLRGIALETLADPSVSQDRIIRHSFRHSFRPAATAAAAAAIALLASLTWMHLTTPKVIARIISVENASWESALPTIEGSELTAGQLTLTSGIATIRFSSGAEVTLEAPSSLILESPMRGKLISGFAVVDVPEPAIGFIIDTPNGYAVDHGTKFSVNVSGEPGESNFEVIKGEISVHLPATGQQVRLKDEQAASISKQQLTTFSEQIPEKQLKPAPAVIRINTHGRTDSVVRSNARDTQLHPDFLMVRHIDGTRPQERRALMSFNISKADLSSVAKAKLWLNQVPSGIGFATRLPVINRFAIYGITDESKETLKGPAYWKKSPQPEDGILLGTFEIPRSIQTGQFGIEGQPLLDFLKSDTNGTVTLLLVRETGEIHGKGAGLVHAFASDSHPAAPGPFLKLVMKE